MKLPITLLVITLNEEKNLARCLQSVPFASELLVIDSGSRDSTVAIAGQNGARVLHQEWLGYGAQKAFGSKMAQYDWILSLDADEALSPGLAQEIQSRFAELNPEVAYEMPRKSFYLERWILHGGWYPDFQRRLYHRAHSRWPQKNIHEKLESKKVHRLQGELLHYVFENVSDQVLTNDRYSTLQAQDYVAKGGRFSFVKWLVKPVSKFFECYILKQGFRDGRAGFFIAVSAAYSVFLRWIKVWEYQKGIRR